MARYSIAINKTTTAAAGLITQLRAGTGRDLRVYEIGIFVTSAAASTVGLIRPSAVGAVFTSSGVGAPEDAASQAGVAVVDTASTTAPTIGTNYMRRIAMPSTIGSGMIWTFPFGINVPTGGSLALWQISATTVGFETYFVYDE